MTSPLLLILFAGLIAGAGPVLRRGTWPDRSPRLAVFAWQALTASAVLSVVLAGAALAMPVMPTTNGLADFLQACAMVLRRQYSTPGGALLSGLGAVTALAVLARLLYCLLAELSAARRERNDQLRTLSLISRRDAASGVLVVEHAVPAAYCLPGGHREIVFTTAALRALDGEQRDAVLRHELSHLHGRHHVILSTADALARAFPGVPLFVVARTEMGRLVELIADDRAADGTEDGRRTVAGALVRLAEAGAAPAPALAAGGTATVVRVRRLTVPAVPLRPVRVLLTVAAATAVLTVPMTVAATPALAAAQAQMCPVEAVHAR